MSTKKRFSIAPDLAQGLRDTVQSASSHQGQLNYDMMSIDVIEPDPQNPRKLKINREDVIRGLNASDPDYEAKKNDMDALTELAESIKRIGVRNAIEVYKEGQKYRIISGERRYLATVLLGQHSIPVRINTKPDELNLRYMQWVENINRKDLSLGEKYHNLLSIAEAFKGSKQSDLTVDALQRLIGTSNIQAYRYHSLLNADKDIVDLILAGKLNNLKIVQELMTMKNKRHRDQIITSIKDSKNEVVSLSGFNAVSEKKISFSSDINIGKIKNHDLAKYLFELVLSDERFNKYKTTFKSIDWSSAKSINNAFKKLFKTIESEIATEEIH